MRRLSWVYQPFFTLPFSLGRKAHRSANGCQFLNVYFSGIHPLNSVSHLRGLMLVLAIVFVGQCEVFVCLGFVSYFLLFLFLLAVKLIGLQTGCQFLKNVYFSGIHPLKKVTKK